jgi:hypothetical protein
VLLIQKLARFIEAIFPDMTKEEFNQPLGVTLQVQRALVNMWIDDETVEHGGHEFGLTAHDFLWYTKQELQELARANLNRTIAKDNWPFEDLMKASELLVLNDGDVDKTAEIILERAPNSTIEAIKSSIIETIKILREDEAKITNMVEEGRLKLRRKVQTALSRVREYIFEKQVITIPNVFNRL